VRNAAVAAIALAIAAGLAGCGGGGGGATPTTAEPAIEQAQPFADHFVPRLLGGPWKAVVNDTSPQVRKDLRRFQATIKKNGVRTIVGGHGFVKHNCPSNPAAATTTECISYHLLGGYSIPITGQRVAIKARLRLWLEFVNGRWRVLSYDYDAVPKQVG
jgi:hypothetical protein